MALLCIIAQGLPDLYTIIIYSHCILPGSDSLVYLLLLSYLQVWTNSFKTFIDTHFYDGCLYGFVHINLYYYDNTCNCTLKAWIITTQGIEINKW